MARTAMTAPRAFVGLGVAVALGGCVTMATVPEGAAAGADYAAATFELGITDTYGIGYAMTQEFRIGETGSYADSSQVKTFGWMAKGSKDFLLATGRPLFIFAEIKRTEGGYSSYQCQNLSSFVPQSHGRYRITQTGDRNHNCEIRVIDLATGTQPDDLREVIAPPW